MSQKKSSVEFITRFIPLRVCSAMPGDGGDWSCIMWTDGGHSWWAGEPIKDLRENMTEPKLEIERRVERLESAVKTMAKWLGEKDAEKIEKILRGEELNDSADKGLG